VKTCNLLILARHVSPCRPARCHGRQVSWSPCVFLSAYQVSQLPCVGPLGVKAATCPPVACQVSRSSSIPCRPARCHGYHVSIPGVTGTMCPLSANHVSRQLCVPLSACQVSRLPCVVPPGVKATRCQCCHVLVHEVSRAPCVGPQGVTGACVPCRAAKPYCPL